VADIKVEWGAASQGITVTLASLAQAACRQSTVIDNTTTKYLDAMIYLAVKLGTGTPGSDKVVKVYLYVSEDGNNYTDNATGSDAALTLRVPTNLIPIAALQCPDAGGLTWKIVIPSVAAAYGGFLPPKWGIVVENRTNIAFTGTEGDHTKEFRGIYQTAA
jgi:hypothetical protein